jgi:hypothetical protein
MKVLYIFSAAAAVLLVSGCTKALDYFRDNPGEVIKQCQVQTLTVYSDNAGTVDIDYNSAGNPVDMIYHFFDTTGPGSFYAIDNHFRYDKRNRLTDNLADYTFSDEGPDVGENFNAVTWDRYSYPRPNVVLDSFFDYGTMPGSSLNPPLSQFAELRIFQLDGEGRIIKMTLEFPGLPGQSSIGYFSYDRNGNLVIPGVTYDSTVNPYRTNAVWMFIYQNYSVNNPNHEGDYYPLLTPLSYSDLNAFGLPQVIAPVLSGGNIYAGSLFGNGFFQMNITYACSCTAPSLKAPPSGGL